MTDTDALHNDLHDDLHDDHHPTENQYWGVFVLLAVVTAIEVAWSYSGFDGPLLVLPLVGMMIFKFLFVAGAFMHLYFDLKIIHGKWFTWTFAAGLGLALSVFLIVIATFQFQV